LPDLRSASDVRKGLLSAADDRTREKPLARPRTPPRRPPSKGGRRITWSRSLATAPGQHTFQPTDGGYTSAASDDQFHATTAPSEYTHGTGGGSSGDAQADMPSGQASGATCVQKLDDSRNSAIHTTYRISLRSSSLREPRYPLLRVVCYSSRFASPRRRRARPRGGGRKAQTRSVEHGAWRIRGAKTRLPPASARRANWPRKGRTRTGSRKSGRGVEPLGRGARARARHDREGRSPPARGAREDERVFAGFTALCVQ
jgi:hypothetical protein